MLPLEWRTLFTFTVMLLKMGKLSLESINTTGRTQTTNIGENSKF